MSQPSLFRGGIAFCHPWSPEVKERKQKEAKEIKHIKVEVASFHWV